MNNLNHIKTLPDLIKVAIDDSRIIENSAFYTRDMHSWHNPEDIEYDSDGKIIKSTCAVCMAGAIIANTLKVDARDPINPNNFDEDTRCKLELIDAIRRSCYDDISNYLRCLGWETYNNFFLILESEGFWATEEHYFRDDLSSGILDAWEFLLNKLKGYTPFTLNLEEYKA